MAASARPIVAGKLLVWLAAGAPLAWLVAQAARGGLGVNPIETLTDVTGTSALVLLITTLAVTPLRRLTGWNRLIRFRRLLGLWAFAYAALHFLVWGLFDHQFAIATITEDVVERPFITVGFAALLILLVLAATSPTAALRRLGGRRWQRLHRLVYVAAALVTLHYLWGAKVITPGRALVATVLLLLLASRLLPARRGAGPATRDDGIRPASA